MEGIFMPTEKQQGHIDKIRNFPAQLDTLLATISEAEYDNRITPDEWSTRQIVHHLADAHTRALMVIKNALFENHPAMVAWKQGEFAETADYKLPIQDSLNILHGIHPRIATLLESLDEEQWQRPTLHPHRGEMIVEGLAQLYDWHGDNHIAQILKTLGRSAG
jgi:hypothetical protein